MGSMMDLLMSAEDKEILKKVQLATLESIEIQKRTEKIAQETLETTKEYIEIWQKMQEHVACIATALEKIADRMRSAT
jgi:hypothetical protein